MGGVGRPAGAGDGLPRAQGALAMTGTGASGHTEGREETDCHGRRAPSQ